MVSGGTETPTSVVVSKAQRLLSSPSPYYGFNNQVDQACWLGESNWSKRKLLQIQTQAMAVVR